MVKKIAAMAGAGAMLLSMAGPAFGMGWWWMDSGNDVDIHNWATVTTKTYTKADSGDNEIGGKMVWGGGIHTGAASAYANVYSDVNSTLIGCNDCTSDVSVYNGARVYTKTYTKADSGDNDLGGMCVGGGWIGTGAAGATSLVSGLVNLTVVGMDAN